MLPKDYKVVANVPYYITAKIIQKLLDSSNPPLVSVLLVQKEVAERIISPKRSLLNISTEVFTEMSLGIEVPAKLFTPPPKVNSQVIILSRRSRPLLPKGEQKAFSGSFVPGFPKSEKSFARRFRVDYRLKNPRLKSCLLVLISIPTLGPKN